MIKRIAKGLLLGLVGLSILAPAGVWAMTKTDQLYMIEDGERVDGNIIATADTVEIRGRVRGDVLAAGDTIIIAGDIEGNVYAAGSRVEIEGYVKGSVWVAGKNVTLAANISHNAWAVGQNVTITNGTVVGWDAYAAGSVIATEGVVSRTLWAAGETVNVGSRVGSDVRVALSRNGSLTLLPAAAIARDVGFKAQRVEQLKTQDGAQVMGKTVHQPTATTGDDWRYFVSIAYIFSRIMSAVWWIVVGIVLVTLMSKKVKEVLESMIMKPASTMLKGLGLLLVTPVVAVLLAITIIGIPLAVLTAVGYMISLYIASILGALFVGQWLLIRFKMKQGESFMWSLVVGAIVVALITGLPFIGDLVKFVLTVWVFGALLLVKWRTIQEWR